jgi:uncharacterized membrane protein YraQ (UPF0718 family)
MMILIGGLVRVFQGLVMAAPTLLTGLFIAAILRYYVGPAMTRRLFGGDSLRALPQSWLIGMLLPVCSIGVFPILFELRRAKVRAGAISAFALSAPLFNPLSLLYGLTLSRPVVIISFALASLAMVTILGLLWDRFSPSQRDDEAGEGSSPTGDLGDLSGSGTAASKDGELIGLGRMLALVTFMARELVGESGKLALIAVGGLGLLGAVLPYSALQSSFEMHDPLAPARMTMLAIPVYATPMTAMSQLGMMFVHSNSPGAALALLLLGTGLNLGTLVWFTRQYGSRATATWFGSLVILVLAASYAIDRPLVLPGAEPAGHTHAFDNYAAPFPSGTRLALTTIREAAVKPFHLFEWVGAGLGALLAVLGATLTISGISERSFRRSMRPQSALDRDIPPSVLGFTLILGLIALSVVGCYAYYPSPSECLEELTIIRTEAFSSARAGNVDQALLWVERFEDWSRKLEVGTFLRHWEVRPYQRMQGYLVRKKLELLEHELEHDPYEQEEVNKAVTAMLDTDRRWRMSYAPK